MSATETSPVLMAAPMQGLTEAVFRNLQQERFGSFGPYMTPFISPTLEPAFTPRQLRDIERDEHRGNLIVQLLTRRPASFIWAARDLAGMGFREVNLNLGCPASTVVARGRGSGLLRDIPALRALLDEIFEADLPLAVSVKTRIGFYDPAEFEDLVRLFNGYPVSRLIVHPRIRAAFYKGEIAHEALEAARAELGIPLVYSGDIAVAADIDATLDLHPGLSGVMTGRGLVANPALLREYVTGRTLVLSELLDFAEALYEALAQAFGSRKNAVMHMKEYWYYFSDVFEPNPKAFKAILKATDEKGFLAATRSFAASTAFAGTARGSWRGR